MLVFISYLFHSVYMEKSLLGRFSSRPGETGSQFAQQGSRLKRDKFLSYKYRRRPRRTSRPASHINSSLDLNPSNRILGNMRVCT